MRISDWSSDVCSSDLLALLGGGKFASARCRRPQARRPEDHDQHQRKAKKQHAYAFGVKDYIAEKRLLQRHDHCPKQFGKTESMIEPRMTPGICHMPPNTTMHSTMIDSVKLNK